MDPLPGLLERSKLLNRNKCHYPGISARNLAVSARRRIELTRSLIPLDHEPPPGTTATEETPGKYLESKRRSICFER